MDVNPYAPSSVLLDTPVVMAAESAELATRWERLAGACIDTLLLVLLVLPVSAIFGIGMMMLGFEEAPDVVFDLIGWLTGLGMFLALNSYLLATRGQTVGKVVMKTQIVDRVTNRVPPLGTLLLKRYSWLWLVDWIPGIGQLIPTIDALMIFRSHRACMHDDVAGTKVIKIAGPVEPVAEPAAKGWSAQSS